MQVQINPPVSFADSPLYTRGPLNSIISTLVHIIGNTNLLVAFLQHPVLALVNQTVGEEIIQLSKVLLPATGMGAFDGLFQIIVTGKVVSGPFPCPLGM